MSIGDLIEGTDADEAELQQQWEEFDCMVNQLQMPFFYLPGNHDFGDELRAEEWHQRLGPSYYHFVYRNVLFLCFNTEDTESRSIGDKQIEYFEKALKENNNVRWTLIFMHQPVWKDEPVQNWVEFESLMADRNYTVFAGHLHSYSKTIRNNRRYYILATTGGFQGNDQSPECQFDHIVWVTMTDEGPVLANLMLDGIVDDQPCTQ